MRRLPLSSPAPALPRGLRAGHRQARGQRHLRGGRQPRLPRRPLRGAPAVSLRPGHGLGHPRRPALALLPPGRAGPAPSCRCPWARRRARTSSAWRSRRGAAGSGFRSTSPWASAPTRRGSCGCPSRAGPPRGARGRARRAGATGPPAHPDPDDAAGVAPSPPGRAAPEAGFGSAQTYEGASGLEAPRGQRVGRSPPRPRLRGSPGHGGPGPRGGHGALRRPPAAHRPDRGHRSRPGRHERALPPVAPRRGGVADPSRAAPESASPATPGVCPAPMVQWRVYVNGTAVDPRLLDRSLE